MQDIHFHLGYRHYPLTFEQAQLDKIDYSAGKDPSQPSFYQFEFDLAEEADTYIDCSLYGKESSSSTDSISGGTGIMGLFYHYIVQKMY